LELNMPEVRYSLSDEFPGWAMAESYLVSMIEKHSPRTLLEIGSGANPTLKTAHLARHKLRYITSDVDDCELRKAAPVYEARCFDVERGPLPEDLIAECDIIFSRMVNEHIRDGRAYHTNVRKLLRPKGLAIHCSATLHALPFLANFLMPAGLSGRLLDLFAPRDRDEQEKFQAYYSWCRGPTRRMIGRFQELGYDVLSYYGYFGHGYYRSKLPVLDVLERAKARLLVRRPLPHLCSYAVVVLRRAGGE
jgi:Methyltransferase domain